MYPECGPAYEIDKPAKGRKIQEVRLARSGKFNTDWSGIA
jgi:hypothetical protein